MLVYAGLNLINYGFVRFLWSQERVETAVYAATFAAVVIADVLTGIAVGVGLAIVRLLYTFSHLSIRREESDGVIYIHLEGAATFIRLPQLAAALEGLPPGTRVHVHLSELSYIDHACLDLFLSREWQLQSSGGELVLDWDALHGLFRKGDGRSSAKRAKANETRVGSVQRNKVARE